MKIYSFLGQIYRAKYWHFKAPPFTKIARTLSINELNRNFYQDIESIPNETRQEGALVKGWFAFRTKILWARSNIKS